MSSPALVYFIKPRGRKGPIKIGCSNVPADRLEALGAWSPWPLEVVGHFPGGFAEEQFLHRCFADDHQHREWFKASAKLIDVMTRVLAAQSLDCVRDEIAPVGDIRVKTVRRKRTDVERLRFSYAARVRNCEKRMRDGHDRWCAPADVSQIIRTWGGYRYWKDGRYVVVNATPPTSEQVARLDEYLADPATHSVLPSWLTSRKTPICIPHIEEGSV